MLTNKKIVKERDNWLNEHGQPSYDYLQSLATDGTLESIEKLKSIATDLNVEYGPNTPPKLLAELISSSTIGDDPRIIS